MSGSTRKLIENGIPGANAFCTQRRNSRRAGCCGQYLSVARADRRFSSQSDDPAGREEEGALRHKTSAAALCEIRNGVSIFITVVISNMALAHSKLTAQGQISIPAKVRQRLGVGPGSVLEWDDEDGRVVVRKAGRYTSEDIHRSLFARLPKARTVAEMKTGIRRHIRKRHARR